MKASRTVPGMEYSPTSWVRCHPTCGTVSSEGRDGARGSLLYPRCLCRAGSRQGCCTGACMHEQTNEEMYKWFLFYKRTAP